MTCSNVFTSLAEWTKRRSAGTDLFTYYGWFLTTVNFIQYDLGHPVIEQRFSLRWSRIYGPCYVRGGDFFASTIHLWRSVCSLEAAERPWRQSFHERKVAFGRSLMKGFRFVCCSAALYTIIDIPKCFLSFLLIKIVYLLNEPLCCGVFLHEKS